MKIRLFLFSFLIALLAACSSGQRSPYATPREVDRSPLRAEQLTIRAAVLIDEDPEQAERLLREALEADLFHGPAHNDLGVILLNKGDYYEAAQEFEWARKLMPGHPDPRMNLSLTLERAGRIDEALSTYAGALEVYPNHLPTIQAMTRCQLRHGKTSDQTQSNLAEIALRGENEEWREWAQEQLVKRPRN